MPTPTAEDRLEHVQCGEPGNAQGAAASEAEPMPSRDEQPAEDIDVDTVDHHRWQWFTAPRVALIVGITIMALLGGLIAILGVRAHHERDSTDLRAQYLQAGRQGAVNLTTIDWRHADADVQRILDSATGSFYDDFDQRSAPFVEVVKKLQSVSTGTVAVAGLETSSDTDAQVLVAVNVETTTTEAPQPTPRAWRMRISVQKVGNDVKVSNVEFVP